VQDRIQRAEVMVGMEWIFRGLPRRWYEDHCFPKCLHVLKETKTETVDMAANIETLGAEIKRVGTETNAEIKFRS